MNRDNQYYGGADTNPFARIIAPRYISQRVGLPLDDIKAAGDVMQDRWQQASDTKIMSDDLLKSARINANPNDLAYLEQVNAAFDSKVGQFAGRTDYHNFAPEIKRDAINIASAVKPIYENSAAKAKAIDDASRVMSPEALERFKAHLDATTPGLKWNQDLRGAESGKFSAPQIVGDADKIKAVETYMQGAETSKALKAAGWELDPVTKKYTNKTVSTEQQTQDDILAIVDNGFLADSNVQAEIERNIKFRISEEGGLPNLTPQELAILSKEESDKVLKDARQYAINKFDFANTTDTESITGAGGTGGSITTSSSGNIPANTTIVTHHTTGNTPTLSSLNNVLTNPNSNEEQKIEAQGKRTEIEREYQLANGPAYKTPEKYQWTGTDSNYNAIFSETDPGKREALIQENLRTKLKAEGFSDEAINAIKPNQLETPESWRRMSKEERSKFNSIIYAETNQLREDIRQADKDYVTAVDEFTKTAVSTDDLISIPDKTNMAALQYGFIANIENMAVPGAEAGDKKNLKTVNRVFNTGAYILQGVTTADGDFSFYKNDAAKDPEGPQIIVLRDMDPNQPMMRMLMEGVGSAESKRGFGTVLQDLDTKNRLKSAGYKSPTYGNPVEVPKFMFSSNQGEQTATIERVLEKNEEGKIVKGYHSVVGGKKVTIQAITPRNQDGSLNSSVAQAEYKRIYGKEAANDEELYNAPYVFSNDVYAINAAKYLIDNGYELGDEVTSAKTPTGDGTTFSRFLPYLFGSEGGLNTDPTDSGGITNLGISDNGDGVTDGKYKGRDIKTITKEEAQEIYRTDYYQPIAELGIEDLNVFYRVFDMAVNGGVETSKNLYKKALSIEGNLFENVKKVQLDYYESLNKPEHQKESWRNRIKNTPNFNS